MAGYELLSDQGLRLDGRRSGELRRVRSKVGIFGQADGSAYFEQVLVLDIIFILLIRFVVCQILFIIIQEFSRMIVRAQHSTLLNGRLIEKVF